MRIEDPRYLIRFGVLGVAAIAAIAAACSKEEPAAEQQALPASVASHQVTLSVTGMT